jgi:hypothetical protein
MDGVGPDNRDDAAADPPPSVDALADLQAGLLDDDAAAQLRKRVRANPDAQQTMAALNRVRRDLADLGADGSSAPEVAPEVVDGVASALRGQPNPAHRPAAHTISRGRLPSRVRLAVALAGLAAVGAAIWLGTSALLTPPAPTPSRPTTAEHITVSRPPMAIPLSDQQILDLAGQQPDFGRLADPQRRASCLAGLGYPADANILGARPVQIGDRSAIVLVLPGDTAATVTALAVTEACSSVNTGLLADRTVHRP